MMTESSSQHSRVDTARLAQYLRSSLPAAELEGIALDDELRMQPFSTGLSNLTDAVDWGPRRFVLRRPPQSALAAGANDVRREFRFLSRVSAGFELAPRTIHLARDADVIGVPFFLMARCPGETFDGDGAPLSRDTFARLGLSMVDVLAELHAVDTVATGASEFAFPGHFLERQIKGWSDRWDRAKRRPLDEEASLKAWFAEHLPPPSKRSTIIHNDFKLDNVLLDADRARVVGVVDWELATVGDPLFDLATFFSYLPDPSDAPARTTAVALMPADVGWPTRRALLDHYVRRTGADVSAFAYYEVAALFRLAVIFMQLARHPPKSHVEGTHGGVRALPNFADRGEAVFRVAHAAAAAHPVRETR